MLLCKCRAKKKAVNETPLEHNTLWVLPPQRGRDFINDSQFRFHAKLVDAVYQYKLRHVNNHNINRVGVPIKQGWQDNTSYETHHGANPFTPTRLGTA
jgi:hypothetical protein